MSKKPSITIYLEREVAELYSSLREGSEFKKAIDIGLSLLKKNMFAGERGRGRFQDTIGIDSK